MARTATQASPRLVALVLPGIPGSVPVARRHVRDALGLHGLGEFAQDAAIITCEQGRGLQIVAALSAHWGWRHEDGGKAVFAVLAREV